MDNFKVEPYLWIHLAGIAVAPLTLQLAWLGLAIGDPWPFYGIELLLLFAIAILPILWMQFYRPFDFFSLPFFVLQPQTLSLDQRRTLSRLKTAKHRLLSLITAIAVAGLGWQIYQLAPFATTTVLFLPQWRILGLGIAAIAFLLTHLFIQVPVAVLAILLTSREQWAATEVFEASAIPAQFTILGWLVKRIPWVPQAEEKSIS
jgi:hypothetical protein